MAWYPLLIAAAFIASALSIPTNHVLHEKRTVSHHLTRRRVDPEAIIPLRIALKQSNIHTGYDRLMEVSDPSSERYGQHFSAEEVAEMFAPHTETLETVKSWLIGAGIARKDIIHYHNRGWLAVDLPASKAEELFATEYHEHDFKDGSIRIGCDEYYLPAHVGKHIDLIKPGVTMSSRLKRRVVKRSEDGSGPPNWPHHPRPHHRPPHAPIKHHHPGTGSANLSNCDTHITPPCIKALYGIPATDDLPAASPENAMGLYESLDAFSQEDLNLFFAKFLPDVPEGTSPTVYEVDGGTAPVAVHSDRNTGESDTDLELAYSLIYPQKVVVYQVDDVPNASGETNKTGLSVQATDQSIVMQADAHNSLNDFFDAVDGSYCNYTAYGITGNSPKIDPVYPDPKKGGYKGQLQCGTYPFTRVVSISYGDPENYFPKRYLERQCSEIMKLGMQGHSILNAAGDYGVAEFPGSDGNTYGCISAPGLIDRVYNPDWPSSCPYMTVVGGTRLYPGQTVNDPESAMQVNLTAFNIATGEGQPLKVLQYFASSGGFSNFFTPPAYQKQTVENYLSANLPDLPPSYVANADATNIGEGGGLFNRAGRGYPDVSANGAYLDIYNNGTFERIFGTSLSSPIFASVLTLLNEDRTAVGKGPIGFVNPVLYAHPYVLNDIVNGSNPNCNSSGFAAIPGWDPITGLGTPNYPKMKELFLSLP